MSILDRDAFGIWSLITKKAFKAEFTQSSTSETIEAIQETLREPDVALYIHIPFCTGTCIFCPYVRFPIPRSSVARLVEKYVDALVREIKMYSEIMRDLGIRIIDIHAGGGTPSLVSGKYWKRILESIAEGFDAEPQIAIEANPEDLKDEDRVFDLVDNGVVEVSLGVQSFNPGTLRYLGRRHGVEDSLKAIENLRAAGCKYINMDLMYMAPGQTLEDWIDDLEKASEQDVDEITCYPTLVTPYSTGYKLMVSGKIPEQPGMSMFKKMVYACEDILPKKGYKGLEIYGYSRIDEWKYVTVNYEMEGPLIGLGCGATGFTGGYEYQNTCSLEDYINSIRENRLPVAGARWVTREERAIRYTACRLFICRRLDKKEFKKKFGIEFGELISKTGFSKALKILRIARDLREDENQITLTRKGLFTAHKICWSFVLNVPCRIVEEFTKNPWPKKVIIP